VVLARTPAGRLTRGADSIEGRVSRLLIWWRLCHRLIDAGGLAGLANHTAGDGVLPWAFRCGVLGSAGAVQVNLPENLQRRDGWPNASRRIVDPRMREINGCRDG